MAGGGWTKKVPAENVAALAVAIVIANCIAALAGGFVAGFWSRNWLIQGLGVLLGVITITIVTVFSRRQRTKRCSSSRSPPPAC